MFGTNNYIRIWKVESKGNYTECECTTSKKNLHTNQFEVDFSSKFVRFVGNAHKKMPQINERVKITSCGVENVYERDGKRNYLKNPTFVVFDFERDVQNAPKATPQSNVANHSDYIPAEYIAGTNSAVFEEIGDGDGLPF